MLVSPSGSGDWGRAGMRRLVGCVVALLCASVCVWVGRAEASVPLPSSGGGYTVRIGADSTTSSPGEAWEAISRSGGHLRSGSDGFGLFYVMGDVGADPQFGDRQGWRLTVPSGVRLTTFSVDVSSGSWIGRGWTSGLRYALVATDGDGTELGSPFLACRPTPLENDCPQALRSSADRVFEAPAGTRRLEFTVECVLAQGCSRFANPERAAGGNEYVAVSGGTFNLVDDTAPALTSGFGELWTDAVRWFHNGEPVAAGMGATDNSGVSRVQWYVDGSLAFDTSGLTSLLGLGCDFTRLKPCSDAGATFPLGASLFTIPDGEHELAVVARDAGGNVSPPLARRFRVDDTPPPRVPV